VRWSATKHGKPTPRGERVCGAVWQCTLAEPSFERTVDPAAAGIETRTFRLPPGRHLALAEFFRRVRYAEHHFGGFGPGWSSDLGRIYVKPGGPAQVESRAGSTGAGTPEIWADQRPERRFAFEDRAGFGRFVLVNPAFE
jgi:hypothetical protein